MLRALPEDRGARVNHYGRQLRRGPERRPRGGGDEAEGEHELQLRERWFFRAMAAHDGVLYFVGGGPCGVLWRVYWASDSARGCVSLALARYFGTRLTCRYVFSALCGAFREIKALGRRGRLGASVKRAGAVPGAPRYAVVRR